MKTVNAHRVSFTKADLAHLADGQMKIVCVFTHILNRLKMLETQVYGHMNVFQDRTQNLPKREFAVCACVESIILIAGELKEAWEAIQECYYGTKVSKAMAPTLPKDIQERLRRVPLYFRPDSLTMFLRNNFAYHHSPDTALDTLKVLDGDASMVFYYVDEENIFFNFATHIRLGAIAEWLKHDDWSTVISPLMQTIMGDAYNDIYLPMLYIAHEILLTTKHDRERVDVADIPSDRELRGETFSYLGVETEGV